MADKDEKKEVKKPEIDEFSESIFKAMGYAEVSPKMAFYFKELKMRKDRLQPGRLTPEGFAFVALLADLADGKIEE